MRVSALKCLALTRLPSVLCLHVQRRCFDPMTDEMTKTAQHIEFDEVLDLSPFVAFGGNGSTIFHPNRHSIAGNPTSAGIDNVAVGLRSPILYRLASIIEHHGNASRGHYVCYRQLPSGSQNRSWYYCSDDMVVQVPWSRVRQAQAYMLFYEVI